MKLSNKTQGKIVCQGARSSRLRAGSLLLLLLGFVGLSPVAARGGAGPDREAALTAARAALEDGLYELAQTKIDYFLQGAELPAERVPGLLIKARALFGLGQYAAAADLLAERQALADKTMWAGDFAYWRARALFKIGRSAEALPLLEGFETRYPDSPCRMTAVRLRARCRVANKEYEAALAEMAAFEKQYPKSPEAADNLLDWAGVLIERQRPAEAQPLLVRLVNQYPDSPLADPARLWLGRLFMEQGQWEPARDVLNAVATREGADPARRAEAWFALAQVYEARTNLPAATDALAAAVVLERDPAARVSGTVARGKLLIQAGQIEPGLALLKEAIAAMPTGETTGAIQLDLAQALFDQGLYEKSAAEFQHYLEAFADPAGQAQAQMGKGWSLWRLGRPAEAALAFEKAYGLETNSELKVQALFKTADALFASGQYKAAADKYRRVSEEFRGGPLAAPALYQLAECFARLGERARAEQILAGLVEAQPDSAAGDQARLRMAQLKEEQNLWDEAAAEYERVIAACRQEAYCAQAVHARGLIRYRLGRFKEAEEDFVRVFTQYPTNALAEQAFYMRGWCLYLQGRDGEALDIGRQFLTRYPASAWAPEVLFWLGEYQYNRANFADAERQFGELVNQYPSGPLADKALYWAGRAAAAQKEFVRAIDYYTRLAKDYPQSSKLAEARFAQGDALSELGQFAGAILAFEEVIVRFPGSYLADLAWGRKGDCQFTLGKDEPGRYEEALAAYRMVLGSPTATADLKWQAEYKIGRCHEKRGRTADALESYLNVVYSFLAGRERGVPGNPLWFTRAAFNAAALQENAGRWREAVAIYRRVANANVPASDEAAERMRKIRFEHWIMF